MWFRAACTENTLTQTYTLGIIHERSNVRLESKPEEEERGSVRVCDRRRAHPELSLNSHRTCTPAREEKLCEQQKYAGIFQLAAKTLSL